MKRRILFVATSFLVLLGVSFLSALPAHAVIYVSNNISGDSITTWPDDTTGNIAPTTNIVGAATTLSDPTGVAVDANWIYVANSWNNSVDVFPIDATGNVAPTRSIQGAATTLNSPRGVAVDGSWIYVVNRLDDSVTVFPIGADGNVAPTRSIQGAATTLSRPYGVAVDGSWIYVVNRLDDSVDVFPIGADGDVAPTRSIQGVSTTLDQPYGVAVDASWIYVANFNNDSVDVFPINATGDVASTRSIQGVATTLSRPWGVAVDASWIYVTNYWNDSVDVFPIGADGDVVPTRSIQGASTTLDYPAGIAVSDTATGPEITVTDSIGAPGDRSMPFGDVTIGTGSTVETATISNVGNAPLDVSNIQLTGVDTGEYSLDLTGGTSPCGSATPTVPAGTNCTVTVTFNPTSTGIKTASLEISSDDADEGTVNVALSGTGTTVTAPEIDVTDTIGDANDRSMPFGDILVGSGSTVETATISNVGNAPLDVSNIQLTGADALEYSLDLTGGASPCGSTTPTVAAADNCTVTITFNPVITGAKTANLEITSADADEGTVNVALSGTGTAVPAPEIDVNDTIGASGDRLMPFGNITEGLNSAVETVTISNTGAIDLNVSNIQLTGVDTGEYSLDLTGGTSPCGSTTSTVPAAGNCTVTITFSPTSTGLKTADLGITSDDADEGTVNVQLSGTGLAAAVNNPPSSPNLVSPADGQQGLATSVTLQWQPATDPDGDTVSYDVYNCLDPDPVNNCTSVAVAKLNRGADESSYRSAGVGYGGGAVILGLMLAGGMYGRRRVALVIMTVVLSATFLASCHFDEDKTYTVSGLDTGSTYYWVVVANDGNGGEIPSAVWSYTTAP